MSHLGCRLIKFYSRCLIKKCQPVRYMQKGAYEGDGKTTMTILNKDARHGLMIDTISTMGFKLNLGITILGPMIIFPRSVIGWNIAASHEVNRNSLALFKVLVPRPDIIIFGLDKGYPRDAPFILDFVEIIKELDIKCEILPVDKACTTFNFLNCENRYVVGALLPPAGLTDIDALPLQIASVRRALQEASLDEP